MKKNILPPLLALIGGAVGFGLRKWQLAAGFEADTGLAIPGAPTAWALIAWSVLMIGVFAVLAQPMKGRSSLILTTGYQSRLYITLVLLAAVALLVSAGAEAVSLAVNGQANVAAADNPLARVAGIVLPPLRVLLCAGGVFAAGIWGRKVYRDKPEQQAESLALLELCFFFCIWLISDYQLRAADPVVMDYVYEIFAIVTALLGLYYLAGFSFGNFQPRRCVFFALLGTYFSLVTLADSHTLAEYFRYGFAVLFLAVHAFVLINAVALPAEGFPEPEPDTHTETEADDHA